VWEMTVRVVFAVVSSTTKRFHRMGQVWGFPYNEGLEQVLYCAWTIYGRERTR
jgi:hypothetical protein